MKSMKRKQTIGKVLLYVLLVLLLWIMIYPILMMLSGSFKPQREIFSTHSLFSTEFSIQNYIEGWLGNRQYTFGRFLLPHWSHMDLPASSFL